MSQRSPFRSGGSLPKLRRSLRGSHPNLLLPAGGTTSSPVSDPDHLFFVGELLYVTKISVRMVNLSNGLAVGRHKLIEDLVPQDELASNKRNHLLHPNRFGRAEHGCSSCGNCLEHGPLKMISTPFSKFQLSYDISTGLNSDGSWKRRLRLKRNLYLE